MCHSLGIALYSGNNSQDNMDYAFNILLSAASIWKPSMEITNSEKKIYLSTMPILIHAKLIVIVVTDRILLGCSFNMYNTILLTCNKACKVSESKRTLVILFHLRGYTKHYCSS